MATNEKAYIKKYMYMPVRLRRNFFYRLPQCLNGEIDYKKY